MAPTRDQIAKIIDHTFLKTESEGISFSDQKEAVSTLVEQAHQKNCWAVCVRESMVSQAQKKLNELGSATQIVSVIGFPVGDDFSTSQKIELLNQAREDGAHEFDMVIKVQALKGQKFDIVYQDIYEVSRAAGKSVLKVIFENAYLSEDEKRHGYEVCYRAFEDSVGETEDGFRGRFFKTSTGFAKGNSKPIGATLEDVQKMYQIGQKMVGIKPAGGIGNYQDALDFFKAAGSPLTKQGDIDPMKFRIGSSSLLKNLYLDVPELNNY